MTSLAQQLLDISDSLTPKIWFKGKYFLVNYDGILCMCAHGAVQARCNPQVKQAIDTLDYLNLNPSDKAWGASTTAVFGDGWSPDQLWNNRPDWVKQDYIHNGKNHGNADLHWLLGMVGLTTSFNDHPDTTLGMVKAKFKEAAQLANKLSV